MKARILLAMSLFASCGMVWSQTACPNGVAPGSSQCGPSPSYHGVTPTPSVPQYSQVRWADRWGAIAIDNTNSGVGAVTGMSSRRKAEKSAMKQCRAKGGGGCRVEVVYDNQCGAIAWGESYYVASNSSTIPEASERALRECSRHTSDCRIYYSDCSLPVRIR